MSFDVNPPSSKPVIREAASMQNDGGGGNLGYFERGENKDKNKRDGSIFSSGQEVDTFKHESDTDETVEEFSVSKLIAKIILAIKDWFKSLLK